MNYLDIPFDLVWNLAEKLCYIKTYALLGEEAAQKSLESMRETKERGAAKYIAPALSVAIAITTYTAYPRCIDAYREYNRAINPPVRVALNAYAILLQLQGTIHSIVETIESERGGGDLEDDLIVDQRLLLTL